MKTTVPTSDKLLFMLDQKGMVVFEHRNDNELHQLGYASESQVLNALSPLIPVVTPILPRNTVWYKKTNTSRGSGLIHHMFIEVVMPNLSLNCRNTITTERTGGLDYKEFSGLIQLNMPNMYFGVSIKEVQDNFIACNYQTVSVAPQRIGSADDALYAPILTNVDGRHYVCRGHAVLEDLQPAKNLQQATDQLIKTFLHSTFNGDLSKAYDYKFLHPKYLEYTKKNWNLYPLDWLQSIELMCQDNPDWLRDNYVELIKTSGTSVKTLQRLMDELVAHNV